MGTSAYVVLLPMVSSTCSHQKLEVRWATWNSGLIFAWRNPNSSKCLARLRFAMGQIRKQRLRRRPRKKRAAPCQRQKQRRSLPRTIRKQRQRRRQRKKRAVPPQRQKQRRSLPKKTRKRRQRRKRAVPPQKQKLKRNPNHQLPMPQLLRLRRRRKKRKRSSRKVAREE